MVRRPPLANIVRAPGAFQRTLGTLARPGILGVALLGVAIVGVPDYLVGYEISLSIFYLGPVGLATWYAGLHSGALVASVSVIAALAAELAADHGLTRPGIMAWNGLLHLGFMLVTVYLLDSLRTETMIAHELARSDPVTGIANRRAFMDHFQYCSDLAARQGESITLAYIDLDDFKQVNDRKGHDEGDRVLGLVARTLKEAVRRSDFVARLGGDEFASLIAGADRAGAQSAVAKARHALLQALDGEGWLVTCCIGCVTFEAPPPSADAAIKTADNLMYKVKREGKNALAFEVVQPRVGPPLRDVPSA